MTDVSAEDRALLDEAARRIVAARMALPAMMFLESIAPMNLVTASMLHVLTPVLGIALSPGLLARVARLLERRETIPEFVLLLDAAEEARRRQPALPPGR